MLRYAKEVIELVGAFPGREWRMQEIVTYVSRGRPTSKQERERYRKGVRRVMDALIEAKIVQRKPARPGGTPLYIWVQQGVKAEYQPGHEVMESGLDCGTIGRPQLRPMYS